MKKKTVSRNAAFTIVELLTVMSVIALLIGLLVPALALVQDHAKELKQRSQFHSIEAGIELFVAEAEYGTYPPSIENGPLPPPGNLPQDPAYGGAQKLAEAMVGLDLLGFDPQSIFRSDAQTLDNTGVSKPIYPDGARTMRQDLEARVGPFLTLENANAFRIGEIYPAPQPLIASNYVLCDVYAKSRVSGKKTGMPILYYRARAEFYEQDYRRGNAIDDDIYYYPDNEQLLALGTPDNAAIHPLYDPVGADPLDTRTNLQVFEEMILNPQITGTLQRPYRADSYILISAGKDGLYGTGDDITNFDRKD